MDDTGTEFPDLDLAYLDAHRAAGEIWQDMAQQGKDASVCCFEIMDAHGHMLIELPFTEMLRRPQSGAGTLRTGSLGHATASLAAKKAKNQDLAADIASLVAIAARTVEQTQRVLQRARHPGPSYPGLA